MEMSASLKWSTSCRNSFFPWFGSFSCGISSQLICVDKKSYLLFGPGQPFSTVKLTWGSASYKWCQSWSSFLLCPSGYKYLCTLCCTVHVLKTHCGFIFPMPYSSLSVTENLIFVTCLYLGALWITIAGC